MPAKYVQGPAKGVDTTEATNFTATLTVQPKAGDFLIAAVSTYSPTGQVYVTSIVQPGVTWSLIKAYYNSTVNEDIELWLGIVSSGAGTLATVNMSAVASVAVCDINEYSGLVTTGQLDQQAQNNGHSNAPDSGTTPQTTYSSELCIAALGMVGISYFPNFSNPTSPWKMYDGVGSAGYTHYMCLALLENIVNTLGKADVNVTSTVNYYWTGIVVTLKATAVAGKLEIITNPRNTIFINA